MGHILNANAFRLGFSKKWVSSWIEDSSIYLKYLHEDFVIFRFIKLFFTAYSQPLENRSSDNLEGEKTNNQRKGLDDKISNQFVDLTFVFSNVSVSRGCFLGISCYFFDAILDEWRLNFKRSFRGTALTFFNPKDRKKYKPVSFIDLRFFPKFFRETSQYRRKQRRSRFFKRHIRLSHPKRRVLKRKIFNPLNYSELFQFNPIHKKQRKIASVINKRASFRYKNDRGFKKRKNRKLNKQHLLKYFPIILYKISQLVPQIVSKHRFKLLKICLILFQQKLQSWKQQYFFICLLKNLLLSLFRLESFRPPFFIVKILNSLLLREFSFKHLNYYYFKKIYQERYLIFQGASSAIYGSLKSFDKSDNIVLSFFGMHVKNISASLLTNYIIIKLGKYFTINEIIRPFLRFLKRMPYLNGFRILVAGRLTRKERAAYIVRQNGDITLGSKSCYIDYAADFKIMRFGVVGVKVWFHLKYAKPNYYIFSFKFKSNKIHHGKYATK